MTARVSQMGGSQDFLATLEKMYRSRSVQRDALGRRMALPSEIARLLAESSEDPTRSLPSAGRRGFTTSSASEQDVSER